jgi:hypothetical protein
VFPYLSDMQSTCTVVYCTCSLSWPAKRFLSISQKARISEKNIELKTRVSILSTNSVRKFLHLKKNSARYYIKCEFVFLRSIHVYFHVFIETWIFSTDFRKKKPLKINFHENPSSGSRVFPFARTDSSRKLCWSAAPKTYGHRFRFSNLDFRNTRLL